MADQVIVASKVKGTIKELDLRVSGEAVEAINAKVVEMIGDAAARAKANNRATLRACDL